MGASQAVTVLESHDLDELKAEFPDYLLWYEQTPRRAQYVARCLHLHACPHTVITTVLAELRDALRQGQGSLTATSASGSGRPGLGASGRADGRDGIGRGEQRRPRSEEGFSDQLSGPSGRLAPADAGAWAVPISRSLILTGRDLMARTVDLPTGRSELLAVLGEYRRALFALTVQGVEL